MALASNALITVANLVSYMRDTRVDEDLLTLYSISATSGSSAATAAVSGGVLALTLADGDNAGTDNITLSAHADVDALVTAINAVGKGWMAAALLGKGDATPTDIPAQTIGSVQDIGSIQFIYGLDRSGLERSINAASDEIETWCSRTFASTTYTQLVSGRGTPKLRLRQIPIVSIARVAIGARVAFTVQNSSTDAQDATIKNDGTNLTLVVTGGANEDSSTIALATYTDIGDLVTQIVAVGNGWAATLDPSAETDWPSTEVLQFSPRSALGSDLRVWIPEEASANYETHTVSGILERKRGPRIRTIPLGTIRGGWPMSAPEIRPMTGESSGPVWPDGRLNIWVEYTAGYATVPFDVQDVCSELAANRYKRGMRDTSLTSQSVAGYSYSDSGQGPFTDEMRKRLTKHKILSPPEAVDV